MSRNITHLSCVTASTVRGDVGDTEKDILLGSASLWEIFSQEKFVWKSKSCVAPSRGRDSRQFPSEK